jgi:predicted metal-dependent hydrolase
MAMPPAARQNFRRNAERWLRMSPEERNVMRQRENLRRETIRRETETALRDSGLHLSPQQRAQFESRYIQERRKVEQALRQQIESERQQQLPALIQQLKKEFQIDQPTKGPPAKPVESPKPKK